MTDRRVLLAPSVSRTEAAIHPPGVDATDLNCRVLCRYHMHGTCRYGKDCQFSHDISHDMPSMVDHRASVGHFAHLFTPHAPSLLCL